MIQLEQTEYVLPTVSKQSVLDTGYTCQMPFSVQHVAQMPRERLQLLLWSLSQLLRTDSLRNSMGIQNHGHHGRQRVTFALPSPRRSAKVLSCTKDVSFHSMPLLTSYFHRYGSLIIPWMLNCLSICFWTTLTCNIKASQPEKP